MEKFIYPQYNGNSLLNVPSTILSLFGVVPIKKTLPEQYYKSALGSEKIILFLIDGLGFNLFEQASINYSFFKNLKENAFTKSITTVFPSTTSAALNTLYSGLSPLEHGLPEWFVYFPEFDAVLESLPFNPVDPSDFDKIKNPPRDILFKDKTIFEYLNEVDISCFSFVPEGLINSLYTQSIYKGSKLIGYGNLEQLSEIAAKLINETKGWVFVSVYYPNVDSLEHKYGHLSEQVQQEISKLSDVLQFNFLTNIDNNIKERTAFILTSDHGQITVDLKNTIFLDEIPGLTEYLKLGKNGKPILPTSGTRNAFLNIKEDKLEFALRLLRKELKNKAFILEMKKAIGKNIFGEKGRDNRFLERTGNILLVGLLDFTLGYHYIKDFELKFVGRHGGLSESEMLIPFACAKVSELEDK